MSRTFKLLAVASLFLARPALAHEQGDDRAMGTVESITPERIVIKASDGHAVSFSVTPETRFLSGAKAASAEDVRPGVRAVVHGKRAGGSLIAVRVKLAAPGK